MRQVHFHQDAFAQFTAWSSEDPALFERLVRLITETARSPFEGIGKPEPLSINSKVIGHAESMRSTDWFTK